MTAAPLDGRRVSVVVPAYEAEADIEAAVASALDQSLAPLEVIVVDDASRDRTPEILRALARREPRLRVVRREANAGPAAARNQGLALARGDWVALLDSDDRFLAGRLERLVGHAADTAADLVADDLLIDGPSGVAPMFAWREAGLLSAAGFLLGNLPDPAQPARSHGFLKPLIRREFLRRHGLTYDPTLRFAEDFAFYLSALLAGARFVLVPAALYRYRARPGSLTARHSIADLSRLLDFDLELEARLSGDPLVPALRRHRRSIERRLYWRTFIAAYKARDWRGALAAWGRSPQVFAHITGNLAGEAVRRSGIAPRAAPLRETRRPPRAAAE